MMTLPEAEAWLDGLINRERQPRVGYDRFGLEAITALLDALGHPERGLSVLHVAGSKGKGSTALIAEALLGALGERVGVFTSPHLERWTERFRVGGAEVSGEVLARAVSEVRPPVDALRDAGSRVWPSFFDATTAAGLVLFRDARVDRTILEVGLGGRLDSTNACEPAVCAITSIELEHTDKLGDTLGAIAGEKAGILKPGVPAVMGRLPAEAAAVVEARAKALGVELGRLGVEFDARGDGQGGFRFEAADGFGFEARLGAPGLHQVDNAGVAVAAVRRLGAHDDAALAAAAREALPGLRLPGRIEVLSREPLVVVDSAHTRASAAMLAAWLQGAGVGRAVQGGAGAPLTLVLSVSLDKDLAAIVELLAPLAARVVLTRAEPIRSLDPEAAARAVADANPSAETLVVEDAAEAVAGARASLPAGGALCVAGSVYLAGAARRALR